MSASSLILAFLTVTGTFSLPPGLLSAICFVESSHQVGAVNINDGGSASHGVCQIKYATAKSLGFKGTVKDLKEYKNNVYWAGAYLNYQLRRYNGDIPKAVAAYNAGTHKLNKKGLTTNRRYVTKVFKAWNENK